MPPYKHEPVTSIRRPWLIAGLLAVTCMVAWIGLPAGIAAAPPVKKPVPDPPVLGQAKSLIEKGDPESAASMLRRFLTTAPRPEHVDDAYLLLGAALYGTKEHQEALKYLTQLQTEFPGSELTDRGKIMAARTHASHTA